MNYMKTQKAELRAKFIAERKAMDPALREQKSLAISKRVTALSGFRLAETILLYSPKSIEVDVNYIAEAAIKSGKAVAYPRCHKSQDGPAYMTYHTVSSLSELHPGSFGLLEPDEDAPLYNPQTDCRGSLCIAPALAFDRQGYRLGYGGGYYDRYFNTYNGSIVGVIFSDFIVPSLPHGKYDIKAGLLISETGVKATVEN